MVDPPKMMVVLYRLSLLEHHGLRRWR